jgi:O-acetyl-ADP-ribose deacetylase (regulator of RNase III)
MMTQLSPRIHAKVADITQEQVCAVVNAANSSLLGGGGVDGAIHRSGGPAILEACKEIRSTQYPDGLPTGEAVITTAGNIPSHYVVHTVGPVYGSCGSECSELLAACYKNSIVKAVEAGCESIAFPAISTGIYGYPKAEAAVIALRTVKAVLLRYDIEVTFIFHSEENYKAFIEAIGD